MSKRIVICSDGTWNTPDQKDRGKVRPSNVVKMARAIAPVDRGGKPQVVFYDRGVGTSWGLDRLTGGAFGRGLSRNIEDAYRFLVDNYVDGDEVYLFGFSRGAYTVRSTAGLIRNCGVLRKVRADKFPAAYAMYRSVEIKPDSEEARAFIAEYSRAIRLKFIGVWDTVGALGVPVRGLRFITRRKYRFHDVKLSRSIDNAFHALAIDEKRKPFEPTLWETKRDPGQTVEQMWFAGVHTNVGGGYADSGLSDLAFQWIADKARECGLALDDEYVSDHIAPNPRGELRNSKTGLYRLTGSFIRPIGRRIGAAENVHPSATERHRSDHGRYSPKNLLDYLKRAGERDDPVAGEDGTEVT